MIAKVIPARDLQKTYKAVIEGVKSHKQPVILTTNNKPQVAIVSLEDLDKLRQIKLMQGNLSLLQLASNSQEELASLPADLRQKANEILYHK